MVTSSHQVDATYRNELRELNELNFARFEAKLDQGLAELRAEFDARIADLRVALERRLGEQTRWLFAAWAVVLASVAGLWFRR